MAFNFVVVVVVVAFLSVPVSMAFFSFLLSPALVSAVDAHRPVKSTLTI